MATLSDSDFQQIREIIGSNIEIKTVLKAWGLDKATWKAAFQASEDWFVNGFNSTPSTSYKAAIEVVTGATTVARAKHLALAWIKWRYDKSL